MVRQNSNFFHAERCGYPRNRVCFDCRKVFHPADPLCGAPWERAGNYTTMSGGVFLVKGGRAVTKGTFADVAATFFRKEQTFVTVVKESGGRIVDRTAVSMWDKPCFWDCL